MDRNHYKNYILAMLSGIMLTFSFPPIDLHWLAWISLVPLLISTTGKSLFTTLKLSLVTGLTHYLSLIYWIALVLSNYGDINVFMSITIMLLLASYLSLYIAVFPIIVNLTKYKSSYMAPIFWGAAAWISLEYVRAHLLTGFPWCLLGYSQYSILPLIQISDCAGVYGVSFIIVMINLSIYNLFFVLDIKKRKHLIIKTAFTFLFVGLVISYGFYHLNKKTETKKAVGKIKAAIVQGNIDQTLKWRPELQEKTIDAYRKLSKKSARFNPDIIVWPETAVPFFFQEMPKLSEEIFRISKNVGANILFGSPAYSRYGQNVRYYNRAYVINEDKILGYYDKIHLVPFGEYVPLKKFLPFAHRLVVASGDFLPGKNINPIAMDHAKIAPLICFESIFPNISRTHAARGSNLLVNITNDAWFGKTSAPYQHLSMAVFRCVENGLPMLRAANTGVSAFILDSGKIVKKSRLFTEDVLMGEIKYGSNNTFYSKYGDIFAIIIIIIFSLKLFWLILMKKRS